MPNRPSADDPLWGPAREYRARRTGRRSEPDRAGVPVDEVDEADLVEPAGGYDPYPAHYDGYSRDAGFTGHDAYDAYDEGYPDEQYEDAQYEDEHREGTRYGAARPRRRTRRRRPGRWLVLLVLIALIGYPVALALTAMNSLHRVEALSGSADTAGRNYLVVGSDSRTGTDLEAVAGTRTDSIMLLHVPSSGGPSVIMSIPRDSYVTIPGRKNKNKINASYSIGGPKLLVQTVEENTGLHIDGYVETGFAGFGDIINAVGGITICPTRALQDKLSGLDVQPGCQPADGTTALAYARMRHGDPLGDLGRIQRQREVISQLAKKASDPKTLLNPFSAFPLARAGGNALTVDQKFGLVDLGWFGYGIKQVSAGKGLSMTVPISDPGRSTRVGQVVIWDENGSETVFNALKDDSTEALRSIAEQQQAEVAQATTPSTDG